MESSNTLVIQSRDFYREYCLRYRKAAKRLRIRKKWAKRFPHSPSLQPSMRVTEVDKALGIITFEPDFDRPKPGDPYPFRLYYDVPLFCKGPDPGFLIRVDGGLT